MRTEHAIRLMAQAERVEAVELLDELLVTRPLHSAWPLLDAVRHDLAAAVVAVWKVLAAPVTPRVGLWFW